MTAVTGDGETVWDSTVGPEATRDVCTNCHRTVAISDAKRRRRCRRVVVVVVVAAAYVGGGGGGGGGGGATATCKTLVH